ncbi:MAG: hypothetical protein ABFS28_16510 [Bacteroidota bacterium]
MDKFEIQRKVFTIVAILELVAVLSLIAVIPRLFKEVSPGGIPKAAGIATSVAMGIRLLILIAVLFGIRVTKRRGRVNREINLAAAVVLILLGLVLMDGAFAYVDSLLFVSIGMFVCVFCDLAAGAVSITAMFRLKPKKK